MISKWSNKFTWTAIIQGAIVTAQFYHHFEIRLEKKYHPKSIYSSRLNVLMLMYWLGILAGACLMMIQAGYLGDRSIMQQNMQDGNGI
jgi:hypothetical protein